MKFKKVNIATAQIQGLTEPPYYYNPNHCYYWNILFEDPSTLLLKNLPFIEVGNTQEEGEIFCNQLKENFGKSVAPFLYPIKDGDDFVGFIDIVKMKAKMFTGDNEKDIHERDINYLEKSYQNSLYIADKYNWNKIKCVEDDKLRSIDSIHEEIYNLVIDNI